MNRLDKLWKLAFSILIAGALITFSSCDEDSGEPEPTETLAQLLAADTQLSTLAAYIEADAELQAIVEGSATYTLFAPNNAAFTKLETLLGSSLDDVAPSIVASVLRFHFSTTIVAEDGIANASIATLQGESVLGNGDGTIQTGGSDEMVEVLDGDIRATNGVMHKVETILVPPTIYEAIGLNLGKLSQPILLGADFTILAAGIAKADEFATGASQTTISSILISDFTSTNIKYTVFAPSNATFEAGSITADTYTGQQWYGIIMNHIVAGEANVVQSDLTTCASFSTLAGASLVVFNNTDVVPADNGVGIYFDSNGDVVCDLSDQGASLTNLDAELALPAAYTATNGLLHVIAGVLAPPVAQEQ